MSQPAEWTVQGVARSVIWFLPAYLSAVVFSIDEHWTRIYDDDLVCGISRNRARLWATTAGLFHAAGILLAWRLSLLWVPHLNTFWMMMEADLPRITHCTNAFPAYGWILLLFVPLEATLLYRLRVRGGVYGWYAEMLNGLVYLAIILIPTFVVVGSAAPFVPIGIKP